MKIVIIGGVAGGANVATRARRLSEDAEIVIIERGPHVSFANCGLPYHIGGEIPHREALLVQTPAGLKAMFNIDVRVQHEVTGIDRVNKTISVRNLVTGELYREGYDHLVLSTGAAPLRPPLPGLDLEGIFVLRDIEDMDRINDWLTRRSVKTAVIAGGGFIGLEVAEQLHRRNVATTVINSNDQVLMPLDVEMAAPIASELQKQGVRVVLSEAVTGFESEPGGRITVTTKKGSRFTGDIVILSIGVRPDSELAKIAGIEMGEKGAVIVNEFLQTSDPSIWAVGDVVQFKHRISGKEVHTPLAGPANRGGRLIADNILGTRRPFRGPIGTAIIRVFDLTAACTGLNERTLQSLKVPYAAVHLHPNSHAGYFPGSTHINLKLLFDPSDGKVLGAQAVGKEGVDKRIDVIATAIAGGLTVEELGDLDLCYAPPFGSAKDPVNMAGMVAGNSMAGLVETIAWNQVPADTSGTTLLDVRSSADRAHGHIPESIHIPFPELRARIHEVPKDKPLIVYCHTGLRSYSACRFLIQNGYRVRNLSGAWSTWSAVQESGASKTAIAD